MNEELLGSWLDETAMSEDTQRPLVTLSYAESLDGNISETKGEMTRLSGELSSRATHLIRSRHDGILVGIGTVISDDPQLTVRLADGPNPQPIVVDTQLRIPLSSKLLNSGIHPLIFCAADIPNTEKSRIRDTGARVIGLGRAKTGSLNLHEVLYQIRDFGITRLMIEGGGEIITSFLNSALWDRAAITIVPKWLGGYGIGPISGPLPALTNLHWIQAGDDIICLGRRFR